MESADGVGTWLAYGLLWAFVLLCAALVVRSVLFFVSIVVVGLAEKYHLLPGPLRRWLLARSARLVDPPRPE